MWKRKELGFEVLEFGPIMNWIFTLQSLSCSFMKLHVFHHVMVATKMGVVFIANSSTLDNLICHVCTWKLKCLNRMAPPITYCNCQRFCKMNEDFRRCCPRLLALRMSHFCLTICLQRLHVCLHLPLYVYLC